MRYDKRGRKKVTLLRNFGNMVIINILKKKNKIIPHYIIQYDICLLLHVLTDLLKTMHMRTSKHVQVSKDHLPSM